MKTSRRTLVAVPMLATVLLATESAAEPIFASPPHVVSDADGSRIVLFLNEPVSGALAARAGDGFEVRVPRSEVAASIQGQDFGADGWGNGGDAVKHLVLAAGAKGDTSIRIQPSGPVHGIDAHSVDDPPRLVIELLAAAPTRTPAPKATKAPVAASNAAKDKKVGKAAAKPTDAATPRPGVTAAPKEHRSPRPAPTASATANGEPLAVAAAERASIDGRRPTEAPRDATILTALAPREKDSNGTEGEHAQAGADGAPSAAPVRPGALGFGCLWRRFSGVAICVADPKAAPYVGDHTITALVGALARGKLPEPEDTPPVVTPALVYLQADVLFATRAPEGKLLPVVDAYRHALRTHPQFPEAWRARLNIALAYRAMEFVTELRTTAGEAAVDPTAGLVRGLAGDLAFVTGKTPLARDDYRRAADGGGLGACLAGRGRARMALAANDVTVAAAELTALGSLCPPELVADPETTWVRGALALARQEYAAARTLLDEAHKGLGNQDRGGVIADLGAVAEAAGDPKTARDAYDTLARGAYGARAARHATVRLAILDGVGGDVGAGLKRLERLTPEASDPARRALVMQAARGALARGAAAEAIATVHESHVDPAALPLDDQLLMAEAYRDIGLVGEAERVLNAAQAAAGPSAPDALFAARGTLALARRDAGQGLAIADDWIRARGRTAGALGLRAGAAALAGDATGAQAAVAAAVIEDPSVARTLALDVAELLRDRHPAAALSLAHQALEPGAGAELPPARHAAGLAMVGALAEAAGDDDTALAAFTTLTARYGKEPVAADAAYRAARIAARKVPGGDAAAFDDAVKSKDPLARRVAGAARDYEAIMKPFAGNRGAP